MNRLDLLRPLLAKGPLARPDAPFRLLEVTGPDAGEFLHRLCTQDVLGLKDGEVRPAAFLDAKGKLLVTCLVFRLGASFLLETQAEQADRLASLLDRYHFTEKVEIARTLMAPMWEMVRGGCGAGQDIVEPDRAMPLIAYTRRGVSFWRRYTTGALRSEPKESDGRPMEPLRPETAECLRMFAGFVRVGVETEPTTLALEADLDDHVSTTKGCYTGQEIVARIHTYGHVNRKLCLLHLPAGPAIDAPQPLHELEDKLAVGRVMHAVPLPDGAGRLGVGYLPKDFQALGTKLALADGTAVEVIGYEPLAPLPA